jgi:ribosomal protein S20
MPVTTSSAKALRRDRRRRIVNLARIDKVKTATRKYRHHPTPKNLVAVYSEIDKAVKKNLYHPKKGDRLKSRLSALLK